MNVARRTLLRRDLLGSVCRVAYATQGPFQTCLERDTSVAWWCLRPVARWLAAREAHTLDALHRVAGVPRLLDWDGQVLTRAWIVGESLQHTESLDPGYYRKALQLLRQLHAAGVVRNGSGISGGWLVTADGTPGMVGLRRARRPRYRGLRFKALASEDWRRLLAHKQRHCPQSLTARQRRWLEDRSVAAALWARWALLP